MPRFRLPTQLSAKSVLIGAAGGAFILLPLGQVLNDQNTELNELAAERAALDPLGVSLSVQRGVLAHREVADRVLRGRSALEPERRIRKGELDDRLRLLQDTLTAGWWVRALRESQSLSADWQALARRIALRQLQPEANLDAHQLLMEQAVQVMDLIETAAAESSTGAAVASAGHHLIARANPSSAERQAQLAALEALVLAMDSQLSSRQSALKAQRAGTVLALGALLALALTLLLTRQRVQPTPPGAEPAADLRRSAGRRASDLEPQADAAGPLMERLRGGKSKRESESR